MNLYWLSIVFAVPFLAGIAMAFSAKEATRQWWNLAATLYLILYVAVFGYWLHVIH
jgi:hypothetical protein